MMVYHYRKLLILKVFLSPRLNAKTATQVQFIDFVLQVKEQLHALGEKTLKILKAYQFYSLEYKKLGGKFIFDFCF